MEYTFTINDFEGPLDLLLHLVRTSKMDIYTINIKDLIDEYIKFIELQDRLNIDVSSSYLVMASDLIHIKSKMLINKSDEEEEENDSIINSEEELRNRLIEYEKIKSITDTFKDLEEKRSEIYEKSPEKFDNYTDKPLYEDAKASIDDLYEAILNFQKRLSLEKPLNTKITKREISIEDRVRDIRNILNKQSRVNFLDLFDVMNKEYIVVTFLSVLDMSKNKEINILQEGNFKPIIIEKR